MQHKLAGLLGSAHRRAIHAVVSQLTAKSDKKIFELMPIVNVAAQILETEYISAFGGMTGERTLGVEGKSIDGISTEQRIFEPGAYQESITFGERELLKLRKIGTYEERGVTGLNSGELNYTDMVAKKLELRLMNRMQQLGWTALFEGTFTHAGIVKDFGIPTENKITAASDWSAGGDALVDLINLYSNNDVMRKYKFNKQIINPKTEAKIKLNVLDKHAAQNANVLSASMDDLLGFYAPTLPKFEVIRDSYQDESLVNGKIVTSHAKFFVPDDKILPIADLGEAMFPKYGEIQITENINNPSADVDKPAQGVYTFIDEDGLRNRQAPSVKIVSGFNGGANLMRPHDLITIDC